jgi:hypothetical protein
VANLIIEMPEDLARSLQGIAEVQHKTVQELAIEGLRSLVEVNSEHGAGSADAVLLAMLDAPHPSASDMDEFDTILAAARLPVQARELFPN